MLYYTTNRHKSKCTVPLPLRQFPPQDIRKAASRQSLRRALAAGGFALCCQPIVPPSSHRKSGALIIFQPAQRDGDQSSPLGIEDAYPS